MDNYFNTNKETGDTLAKSKTHAQKQQETILEFFRENPYVHYSTFEINQIVMPTALHTSIRRAITNLTTAGFLKKTDYMIDGPHGKKVHTWILSDREKNDISNYFDILEGV